MNMHVGSPQKGAESIPAGLLAQDKQRAEDLKTLRRLQQEAADEVERLLAFLDAVDGYTMTELEPSTFASGHIGVDGGEDDLEGDDGDLEPSLCGLGAEHKAGADYTDMEEEQDGEPSLGSLSSSGGDQAHWGKPGTGDIDAEDEHDGAEPEDEDGDGEPDLEPSLGWTENGTIGASNDRERQDYAASPPVKRKARGVTAEQGIAYNTRWLRHVPPGAAKMLKSKLNNQVRDSGVRIVDF